MRGSEPLEGVLTAAFSSVFVALAWIDLERGVIPNQIVYPALALAFLVSGLWPNRGPIDAFVGGLGAFSAAAVISVVTRGGLGGGDVKMSALVGTAVHYPEVVIAGVVTGLVGGLVALLLVATRRSARGGYLPYGPFIALGGLTAFVA